jgi:hypothetical protein
MQWVTRERPKIDRLACPWLVRRFIDRDAEFLYVPSRDVMATARVSGAIPFDVPGVELTHDGPRCSFDAFIRKYRLEADAGLGRLASIVRAADTDTLEHSPQAPGLLAIMLGLGANIPDDHALLEAAMPVYDALYTWCCDLQADRHASRNEQPVQEARS